MKRFGIIALAALLVVAFSMPAAALENVFGGYWRARFFTQQDFSGADDVVAGTGDDLARADTRTRLYYTAVLNENLKFVNKFEFNTVFGDLVGGDLGADGNTIVVKNSYADFNLGPVNAKVGIQGLVLSRGFLMDDDFSGVVLTYKGEGFSIPFVWIKPYEGGEGEGMNDRDVDYYALAPTFTLGEGISINPILLWGTTDDASGWAGGFPGALADTEVDLWVYGLNADAKFGPLKLWFTGLATNGDIDYAAAGVADDDISGYLIDFGAAYDFGVFDIHGEYFYASGDDNALDNDIEQFAVPGNPSSHYWAEIMGLGIFDNQPSDNSCADDVSNIWALNLGTKIKPMDKLTVAVDLWYAELAEERAVNVDETLGTELDVVLTYQLVEGLNMDVVGAYLWTDEGTYKQAVGGVAEEDAYELGTRLSLSF